MTSNPHSLTQLTTPTANLIAGLDPGPDPRDHTFEMRFTSTPRGARLARRLAALRLDAWGIPYDTDAHDAIVLIVAELTVNAVLHGHVSGRDFHLRVHVARRSGTVRVGVTDTRSERLPPRPGVARPVPCAEEGGRGLLLVAHLAARWDWHLRTDGPGKTIWAEYELPGSDHAREGVR
ncbi:ATP-binding protein [Streptomyces phaeochromogenes]|uniref:ATP-binding protein n=1 Tax=Streptomyces phaeochromogenes TaxID=1923 RepID=UPI0038638F4F|nr:ATP-binding protein [Streptomyces phaeochromogenes]